ncbi:MAG: cyclase family protein [Deltaproteobacteria bacterium]|nr:cyclase family protein [Candidatus Zymogenaceae bacterium]
MGYIVMGKKWKRAVGVLLALGMVVSIALVCRGIETENSDVVDLTRPLGPGRASFTVEETTVDGETPGSIPDRRIVFAYEPGLTETTALVSPRRWVEGGATLDDFPTSSLVVPVSVIDATDLAGGGGGFALDAGTLMRYETFAGEIPEGAAVLVALGGDPAGAGPESAEVSPPLEYPGLSPDAVTFLVEKRHVSIIGVDTPGIDPSERVENEAAMMLAKSGGCALVNLGGLDTLPPRGGVLVVAPLAMDGADAAPARAFVLVPKAAPAPVE